MKSKTGRKKEKLCKLLYGISAVLLVGFCIAVGADHYHYSTALNSAPFSVFVLARAVEFLIPAIAAWIAAVVIKKKDGKDDSNE